jgi:DNA replication protein DnaC
LCLCPECGGVGYFKLDLPHTHPDFGKLVRCQNEVHQPQFVARLAARSGLVPEDLETRLADFREVHRHEKNGDGKVLVSNREMLEQARQFTLEPYGFLYLWGGPGNAKSDVLIAVVNEINLKAGQAVAVYIKFSKLVEYMREAYIEHQKRKADPFARATYAERFDQVKAVKVLAIDEFDFDGEKLRETPFVQEFRFDFLDDRYHLAVHGRTATVFASNSPPESLPEPIFDRIRDGRFKIVHNTAPSARPAMRRK